MLSHTLATSLLSLVPQSQPVHAWRAPDPAATQPLAFTWGDVDQDGLDDAFAVRQDGSAVLLWNRGGGTFEDVTQATGLQDLALVTLGALIDMDGDGDLDLFVGSAGASSLRVWRNLGHAAFERVDAGIDHAGTDRMLRPIDFDQDGRIDLEIHTDRAQWLYRNTGGARFERVELALGGTPTATHGAAAAESGAFGVDPSAAGTGGLAPHRAGPIRAAPGASLPRGNGAPGATFASTSLGSQFLGTSFVGAAPIFCVEALIDQSISDCGLEASSTPTLGRLYPLSTALNVDGTGRVGMGTTSPTQKLDVAGSVRASGQLVSAQATGTAPLSVVSTTKVVNLNVDQIDGLDSSVFSQLGASIESAEIANATIVNADVSLSAAIAGTKVAPDFGAQAVTTTGAIDVLGLRTEFSDNTWAPNVIGGYAPNVVTPGVLGATISGGGKSTLLNVVTDNMGTIGGGWNNQAGDGAGTTDDAGFATIAGGINNDATGTYSTIGGGDANDATGSWSTVPGGRLNVAAGKGSLAAGYNAQANHDHSFVWSGTTIPFASTDTNQFLVRADGGVGIGTNAPEAPLHLAEGSAGTVTASSSASAVFERGSNNYVQLLAPDLDELGVMFGNPTHGAAGGIYYNSTVADGLAFRCNGNSTKMVIDASGNVGIGTSGPDYLLHVDGSAGKPGGGSWSTASDARLKTNVAPLDGALAKLLALRGVTFEYLDPEAIGELDGKRTGFIAQEVERVFPDWVEDGPDGYKRLTVRGFEALAVEALRQQQAEIDGLERRLADQEAAIAELTRTLAVSARER